MSDEELKQAIQRALESLDSLKKSLPTDNTRGDERQGLVKENIDAGWSGTPRPRKPAGHDLDASSGDKGKKNPD